MRKIKRFVAFLLCAASMMCLAFAASGNARYFLTATGAFMTPVQGIRNSMSAMGYTTSYHLYPVPNTAYVNIQNSKVWVIHGHGAPGRVAFYNSSTGTSPYSLYSSGTVSGSNRALSQLSANALSSTTYAMYITCFSAATADEFGNTYNSMVAVTKNRGAQTVTGFLNEVGYGEYYADYLFNELENGQTIAYGLVQAGFLFDDAGYNVAWSASPSNGSTNRYTSGVTNKTVD